MQSFNLIEFQRMNLPVDFEFISVVEAVFAAAAVDAAVDAVDAVVDADVDAVDAVVDAVVLLGINETRKFWARGSNLIFPIMSCS